MKIVLLILVLLILVACQPSYTNNGTCLISSDDGSVICASPSSVTH